MQMARERDVPPRMTSARAEGGVSKKERARADDFSVADRRAWTRLTVTTLPPL